MTAGLRLRILACPSLRPELEALAHGKSGIGLQFLDRTLHERSAAALHAALQDAIDAMGDCDAIGLAYGLCNRGILGLRARDVPLVIPRAADCIGLLLGSQPRYRAVLDEEPGSYFTSAGWLAAAGPELLFGPQAQLDRNALAQRYGDEAADYLIGEIERINRHYRRLCHIATPLPQAAAQEAEARTIAARRGLAYCRLDGDTGWLARLLAGQWAAEFLLVRPGQDVVATGDERLIEAR